MYVNVYTTTDKTDFYSAITLLTNHKISFESEPEVKDGQMKFNLSINNSWSVVVFDRALIEQSERTDRI